MANANTGNNKTTKSKNKIDHYAFTAVTEHKLAVDYLKSIMYLPLPAIVQHETYSARLLLSLTA